MATIQKFEVENNMGPTMSDRLEAIKKWMTPCKAITLTIVLVVVAIVGFSLLGSAFQYIDWDEYALKKNTATNDVDYSTVYESGRHFWGVNYQAVKFPRTIRIVNFDEKGEGTLNIFTDAGLQIEILCSFQYRLMKSKIAQMYINFGRTYDSQVISVARSILKNTAPTFLVEQYYQQRQNISNAFFMALKPGLEQLAYVELVSFQLRHIYLADQIVQKLLNIQVQLQINLQATYVQAATIIRKQTESQVAGIRANATIILAEAEALGKATRSKATANGFQTTETARKSGLATLYQTLNFTTPQQKLSYIYTTGVSNSNARILVDTKGALLSINDKK